MLNKNDNIILNIDDLTVEGAGIGRHNGLAVFVPRALPGETVSAYIIKVTKSYAVGRLESIIKRSEHRVEPFCPIFEACGGCTLQHLDYNQQLEFKARHIQACFRRIGGIDIALPKIVKADNIQHYRNKAAFPVDEVNGEVQAGFFAPHSHRLVPGDCAIQKQQINETRKSVLQWANANHITAYNEETHTGSLRHIVARQASDGSLMAGVVLRDHVNVDALKGALQDVEGLSGIVANYNDKKQNAILGDKSQTVWGDGFLTETYDGLKFRADLKSFLQVNHEQSEKLYHIALEYAQIDSSSLVFDLFCGIGTISLLAAREANFVLGIEYVQEAVDNARDNAQLNDIGNAAFLAGDAGEMIDIGIREYGRPDIVILDPPRKGCDEGLIQKITSLLPERIVYVSCNPSTLARDMVVFTQAGYKVDNVTGVDMFPHTMHVETVVLMSRANK